MAAAEVQTLAARDNLHGWLPWHCCLTTEARTRRVRSIAQAQSSDTAALLNARLALIARAWIQSHTPIRQPSPRQPRTLIVPNIRPAKWSRVRPQPPSSADTSESASPDLPDPTTTDCAARGNALTPGDGIMPLPEEASAAVQPPSHNHHDPDPFVDPSRPLVDFGWDCGFSHAGGKKKKKQTPFNFSALPDEGDKDGGDGTQDGNDKNNDSNGGDSGVGGGPSGFGGNDGDKGDENANNEDDIWDFEPVSHKKKNKNKTAEAFVMEPAPKDNFGLPDIRSTDFHEIKLDDTGGGDPEGDGGGGGSGADAAKPQDSLSLSFGVTPEKITNGISSWASKNWGGGWSWSGLKSPTLETSKPVEEKPKPAEVGNSNPWTTNNSKAKKTTSAFNFGILDQAEGPKEDTFDFLGAATKGAEKKNDTNTFSWGAPTTKPISTGMWNNLHTANEATDEQKTPAKEEQPDDVWGWAPAKNNKMKNKAAVVEEAPVADSSPAEADNKESSADAAAREIEAALIKKEEADLQKLQTKMDIGSKLTPKQMARYELLTENAKARADAAAALAAAQAAKEQPNANDDFADAPLEAADPLTDDTAADPWGKGDAEADLAQFELDQQAQIAQQEEEEMEILYSKKKLNKTDKARLKHLEENATRREREAEEAAAAKKQVEAAVEVPAPSADDTVHEDEFLSVEDTSPDADSGFDEEAAKRTRIAQEEEEEMEILHSKKKLNKTDKARLKHLEENAKARAREQEEAELAVENSVSESSADKTDSKTDETAPTSIDDSFGDADALLVEQKSADLLAIEQEEAEMEELLSKPKLKSAGKARLKVLQANQKRREEEAKAKAVEDSLLNTEPAVDNSILADEPPASNDTLDKEDKINEDEEAFMAEEEDIELEFLLSKSKLNKADKARVQELQDNKKRRQEDAALKTNSIEPIDVLDDEQPDMSLQEEDPEDEAALQKEAEEALIAAQEKELADLLKVKPKKQNKARIKELQELKFTREQEAKAAAAKAEEEAQAAAAKAEEEAQAAAAQAEEEARLAQEKADQEAKELEEEEQRQEAERQAAKIAKEEAEIKTLKSKKKLKKSDQNRLAELEARQKERAAAEAQAAASLEQNIPEDDKDGQAPLSWADDDPALENDQNNDWMNWGLPSSNKKKKDESPPAPAVNISDFQQPEAQETWDVWGSSKKDKKKDKSSNLIDLNNADKLPAVPDPPAGVPQVSSGFDFPWGKPAAKKEPVADDIWGFGGNSKKPKDAAPVQVVEDSFMATPIKDFASEFGKDTPWLSFSSSKAKDKKSSRKENHATDPPTPARTPPIMSMEVLEGDNADVWSLSVESTKLSTSKSKSSEKDSNKKPISSKEPKLSKKELEKLEKEKKKAEKEQKAREEQEAKEAAERARIEEEERLAAEAQAEADRIAQEEADRLQKEEAEKQAALDAIAQEEAERLQQEEAEKQAALDAIAQEEADLAALQEKKAKGRKLTKKDKEKLELLTASCQARADEKAAQEAAEQAAREEAERLLREAEEQARQEAILKEEQARQEAIQKEESELKELQRRKDSGRKLLKKDKERLELLTANKKARKEAAKELEAAKEAEAIQEAAASAEAEPIAETVQVNAANLDDDLEKDLAQLNDNEINELDKFLSEPPEPISFKKAPVNDPFSFWGASKKTSSKRDKISVFEPVSHAHNSSESLLQPQHKTLLHIQDSRRHLSALVATEIAHAESESSFKLLEATTTTNGPALEDDVGASIWSAKQDTFPSKPSLTAVEPIPEAQKSMHVEATFPAVANAEKAKKKPVNGKIADKLKAFEAAKNEPMPPPPPPAPADLIPPPPPPAPVEVIQPKDKSRDFNDLPGSFPIEDEEDPDEIIDIIDLAPPKSKKSSSKRSSKVIADDMMAIPIPPPPPAVPDVPMILPPEVKKESKKERVKISRDAGSSWGAWTTSGSRDKDKKSSSKSKSTEESRRERRERSPEKQDKLSSQGSSSDKAERGEKREKNLDAVVKPKMASVFASTPPISRSGTTRDKRHKEGRSSRRPSIDVNSGMISPPEDIPDMNSKAAKILGISEDFGLGRSDSKRKQNRPAGEEDIPIVDGRDAAPSPEKPSRRRPSKAYARDDGAMFEMADSTPMPGLRRANTTGSTKKGLGGLFGGFMSNSKPDSSRKRAMYHTDGEDAGITTDADADVRRAERRTKSKEESRREKRRRQDEEAEAQRQAEKEARRAERRAARAQAAEDRRAAEEREAAKEERRRQRRLDREAAAAGDAEAEARRAARREHRRAGGRESDRENDEERQRRRAEKRSHREGEAKPIQRRRTEPAEEDYVYPRPEKVVRRHTDNLEKPSRRAAAAEVPAWPHSGTSSWVKDHSDAGPPPDDAGMTTEAADDGDEGAAHRERRRRRRYGDVDVETGGDRERRKKRREERSDGSDERRRERKGSFFAADFGGVKSGGGFGGLWKKLKGN